MKKGRKQVECKVYNKVDNSTRLKIVRLVEISKKKLIDVSIILGINYSTVKTIMRLYRSENRIFRKKKGGNLRKKSKKIQKCTLQKNKEIGAIKAIRKIKQAENSDASILTDPISSYNSSCTSSRETENNKFDSKEKMIFIRGKTIEDSFLEDCIKFKLQHDKEFPENETEYYSQEMFRLFKEIYLNDYIINSCMNVFEFGKTILQLNELFLLK
jgi:hypothetical protein